MNWFSAKSNNSGEECVTWSYQQQATAFLGLVVIGFILTTVACSNDSKPAVSKQETPSLVPAATPPTTPVQVAVQPPAVKKPVRRHVAKIVTYADPASGVSFQYPRKYALKVGGQAKEEWTASTPVSMDFIQPGGVNVVAVEMPKDSYPGTDFAAAFFNLSVHKELTEEQCSQFAFKKDAEIRKAELAKEKLGAHEFGMVEDKDGNLPQQTDAKYYHLYDNGACYEFVLGLGTAPHETADDLKTVDRDAVFNQLKKILATVKITPVKTPEVVTTTTSPAPETEKNNQ
jgi:hypothetical protein